MSVFLGNKYQSKQRENIRKIAGIGENNDKIEVENKQRILGQTGTAWVAGNSAASETTGDPETNDCCNKEPKKPDPDPKPDPKPDPDPDPDPDDPYKCDCVSVGHSNAAAYCCVSGKDCETGRTIRVQRRGGNTKGDCDEYRPIPYGDCLYRVYSSISEIEDIYSGFDGLQAAVETQLQVGMSKQEEKYQCKSSSCSKCEGATWELFFERTNTHTCGGQSAEITTKVMHGTNKCTPFGASSGFARVSSQSDYQKYLEWHEKNRARLLYASGGKLYNACDPYGEPPIECVEMCDENGNRYRVCGDGGITPL